MSGRDGNSDAGFLAVDAAVGLALVVMGLIGVIMAEGEMRTLMDNAIRSRTALAQAEYLLAGEWPKLAGPGSRAGAGNGLRWTLKAAASSSLAHSTLAVCEVTAEAESSNPVTMVVMHTQRLCQTARP